MYLNCLETAIYNALINATEAICSGSVFDQQGGTLPHYELPLMKFLEKNSLNRWTERRGSTG